MLEDKTIALSYSMYSNQGVYALLLGSGVSRASGILTGWEIVVELCKKYALMLGEEIEDSPENWYRSRHGKEPTYDDLIEYFSSTPADRQPILEEYLLPKPHEVGTDLKKPTQAHRAIAELVAKGYIKVIITTNFDRLLEEALDAVGVNFTAIYHEDHIASVRPIVHSSCTIIKVHGDYKDHRFKNISSELETYSNEMNSLLDFVFDNFGLIVAGWSADWDVALRRSMERRLSKRYGWYWLSKGTPSEKASELIDLQQMNVISILNADQFFNSVRDQVLAMEKYNSRNPLTSKVAVSLTKQYLQNSRDIELEDLVRTETTNLKKYIDNIQVTGNVTPSELNVILQSYIEKSEVLRAILRTIVFYGKGGEFKSLLVDSVESLSRLNMISGNVTRLNLRRFPSLLAIYEIGMAAIAKKDFATLQSVLTEIRIFNGPELLGVFVDYIAPSKILGSKDSYLPLPYTNQSYYLPANEYLYNITKQLIGDSFITSEGFDEVFYLFEFLYGLLFTYRNPSKTWVPIGRFVYSPDAVVIIKDYLARAGQKYEYWWFYKLADSAVPTHLSRYSELINARYFDYEYPLLEFFRSSHK